jgi:hypothetical protein
MGHSMLATHGAFSPYGWYGHAGEDDFVVPVTAHADLASFSTDFGLKRTDETGLSLVILRPEPDLTSEAIAAAVIRQYFLALVSGRLTVTVDFPGGHYDINRQSVDRLAGSLPVGGSVANWLSLARGATNPGFVIPVINRKPDAAPKWENCDVAHDDPRDLRRRFERGEVLAFSVPVTVRPVDAVPAASFMRVYLVKDAAGRRERPLFVRGGISIPRATDDKLVGVRALGVVTDAALAAFARDSENPSHTEWRRDSTHFKGRYDLGPSTLSFVKQAPAQLWTRLAETEEERDPYSLADLFPLPDAEERADALPGVPEGPQSAEDTGEPPARAPRPLEIRKVSGGFLIAANANAPILPESLEICAAYMVRDGARQALARYNPLDFRLERMRIEVQGANLEHCAENRMVLTGITGHMRVEASGFDMLRDVVIRVVAMVREEEVPVAAEA